jgi:NagD protein
MNRNHSRKSLIWNAIFEERLLQAKGFIFDIDGTLALLDKKRNVFTPFDGAVELLRRLDRMEIPSVAFTNGTFQTPESYRQILNAAGFDFPEGRVMTPSSVAADFFVRQSIRKVMVLGGRSVFEPLERAGICVVAPQSGEKDVDAVLIGWFPEFTFADMQAACDAVWQGAPLYSVSNAPFFAGDKGRILGVSGAIGAMIAQATGKRPVVLGKPAVHGLKIACARMGIAPEKAIVVGDDPNLEILMARKGGALGIGVLTGIAGRDAYSALPESKAAHLVVGSVADLGRNGLVDRLERAA